MRKNYLFFLLLLSFTTYAQQKSSSLENNIQTLAESKNITNSVYLYPNPVENLLSVRSEGIKITKIEICSSVGTKLIELHSNFNTIFLDELTRGIYFIKIYSGKDYTVKKLIKK